MDLKDKFELELRKILIKGIDIGLTPDEMCKIAKTVLESDDWTYHYDDKQGTN